ncbi:MAG TPA: aminoglycoside 3'-phosphotransferase/choline kinase family protein [Candidatus Polarisedimenticolaceae bacterium]|nr:aminoglycoside 3'-phosphotransferase/choline kinase family protein [Candidatus Polarisedimenticolaceae bacterium]
MLPPIPDVAAWRVLRRDAAAQRPAFEAIAARHGLAASELSVLDKGTHFVWATRRNVIKLFVPLCAEDASLETTLLEMVAGTALPVPQLEAQGELDGWPYVVMSRVHGEHIGVAWRGLDDGGRARLAGHLGEAMATLASLPREPLQARAITQDALLAERLERILVDQRERGGDEALELELRRFLAELPRLLPADDVVLHADLTDDNVLVSGDRVTGIIDFADAFVGPWTYELAAPACFVTRGSSAHRDAMFRGRGFEPAPELIATTRAWAILHRYSHVARMMQEAGVATLRDFLELI